MRRLVLARVIAVGLVGVLAVAAVVVWPHGTRAAAAPAPALAAVSAAAPTSGPAGDVGQLRQQRIETLRQASELAERLFAQGLNSGEEVNRWHRELLEAELDSAATKEARVALLRKALEAARQREELASQQHQAGVAPPLATFETKAYRLRVEIQLAQAAAR